MNIRTLHQLKSKFVTREVGNELILVPLSDNVAQMNELFTLNETAKFIWENITENSSIEDIKASLTENFVIDSATAEKDIHVFLSQMESMLSAK